MKRIFDLTAAITALILLSPILIAISILMKIKDKGPIFFYQQRVGRNMQNFKMIKFRTMIVDADKKGSHQTAANDSRITKIGKILRLTSIDELPQLINVAKGDMSLVGPRPKVPQQEKEYSAANWQQIHKVRPGITGLAQVKGRSSLNMQQATNFDLEYSQNNSIVGDVKIIFLTVLQAIVSRGTN